MNKHLDLRVLASFLVLADELNFTRAAVRLHMTQPPLSLQIKQLEAELGVELFHRSKRRVALTPAGIAFRVEAEKMFAQEERARDVVRQAVLGEEAAHLSIGFTPITAIDLMPGLLHRFTAAMPRVRYSLKEMNSQAQREGLLSGELDIGFVRPPVIEQGLSAQLLFSEPHVLAVPAAHPLAGLATVHVRELHGQPLTMFERRTGRYAHDLFMTWLAQSGVEPAQLHDAVQHHAMMAMVGAGIGLALVPASSASQPINGVVFKRLTGLPVPQIELWLATRKGNPNPMATEFIATTLDHVAHYKTRQRS
jgi:DNA-binding transcriptional LysR family regulator